MGNHPMGAGADPNPRFMSERLVDPAALNMGNTAENLHDRFPAITKRATDAYAVASQDKLAAAYARRAASSRTWCPVATHEAGRGLDAATAWTSRPARAPPWPTLPRCALPFRAHGRVTAGNAAGLNDGATAALLASSEAAAELGLPVKMRLVSFAYAGVEPEVMGIGPVPATEKALQNAGLDIADIGLFEINEAFAVQVLSFLDHFGIADDDPRVNRYGGAIAVGHPLASSGVRLMTQLARQFEDDPSVRYGITTMCVGLGMGATVIWENPHHPDYSGTAPTAAATAPPPKEPPHERRRFTGTGRPLPRRDHHPLLRPGHRAPAAAGRQAAATFALITLDNGLDHPSPPRWGPTPSLNWARPWRASGTGRPAVRSSASA